MGRGNVGGFEEPGDEMEKVLGGVQEQAFWRNLVRIMLVLDDITEDTETDLP